MKGLPEAWSKESPPVMTTTNLSRPNTLFQAPPPPCSDAAAAAANLGQDLKDLYLQDLSDGMCYQSSLIHSTNNRAHAQQLWYPRDFDRIVIRSSDA